jgi:hypothetical protein
MAFRLKTRSVNRLGNTHIYDQIYSPVRHTTMWELAPMRAALLDPANFFFYRNDFFDLDDTNDWATVADGAGAPTVTDAVGGVMAVTSGGTNNNEVYTSSITENWKFAASKPLWFEARVALTEANVDDANLVVGVSDTVGADTLLDDGGGPAASYDGAVWFKVDGGVVWQFESSNAGTQVTTASAGAFASNTWYRVGFVFDPDDGTTGILTPYLDGLAGTAQNITLAGLEEMHLVFGAKAGGSNVEALRVDWVQALAVR